MKQKTIIELLDDIRYYLDRNPDLQDIVREGLDLIINKIKDADKWKKK